MIEDYVTVKVVCQLGGYSKEDPFTIYPVNFGYVEGVLTEDGHKQEVYLLGVEIPVEEYTGVVIAKVHRNNDTRTLLVVAPENIHYNRQQIEEMVHFQEQHYDISIEMIDDEIWDAYDEHEHKLGFDIPRSMAKSLPEGVYHIVVMIYTLTEDGNVLITQRARNKTYPLKWEVTGGSILKDESPVCGAIRELKEETGIHKTPEEMMPMYNFVDHERHTIYHSYLVVIPKDITIALQMGETMDYRFLPVDEFYEFIKSDRFVPSEQRRFLDNEIQIKKVIKSRGCVDR